MPLIVCGIGHGDTVKCARAFSDSCGTIRLQHCSLETPDGPDLHPQLV